MMPSPLCCSRAAMQKGMLATQSPRMRDWPFRLEAVSSTEVWLARVGLDYPPPSAARTELAPQLRRPQAPAWSASFPRSPPPSPVCASSDGPMDGWETEAPRFDLRDGKGFLHPRSTGRLSRMKQVDMQHRLCPTEKPRSSAHSPGCLLRGCPDRMPRRRDLSPLYP